MPEINSFDAALTGAMASMPADTTPSAAPAAEAAPATPSQAPAPEADLDRAIEFLDGKTPVKATVRDVLEWRKGHLRLDDYTRKTQEIAAARKELEQALPQIQQLYQEHQSLQQFVKDRDQVLKYAQYLQSLEQQPPAETPPQDLRQVQLTLQQQMQAQADAIRAGIRKELDQERAQAQYSREVAAYKDQFDSTVKGLLDQHPALKDVDGIEALIRTDAATLARAAGAFGVEDAKRFLADAAKARADRITEAWENRFKQRLATKSTALKGIEPPGGSTPPAPRWGRKDLGTTDHLNAIAAAIAANEV